MVKCYEEIMSELRNSPMTKRDLEEAHMQFRRILETATEELNAIYRLSKTVQSDSINMLYKKKLDEVDIIENLLEYLRIKMYC